MQTYCTICLSGTLRKYLAPLKYFICNRHMNIHTVLQLRIKWLIHCLPLGRSTAWKSVSRSIWNTAASSVELWSRRGKQSLPLVVRLWRHVRHWQVYAISFLPNKYSKGRLHYKSYSPSKLLHEWILCFLVFFLQSVIFMHLENIFKTIIQVCLKDRRSVWKALKILRIRVI